MGRHLFYGNFISYIPVLISANDDENRTHIKAENKFKMLDDLIEGLDYVKRN